MTNEEKEDVRQRIQQEGFDYTFIHYSDFKEIEDEEFHKLRRMYINVVKAMNMLLEPKEEIEYGD